MKTLNIVNVVAVLAIAFTLTSCSGPSAPYPPGHPWWTGEPVVRNGQVVYLPQQTDGDELGGQGDGEEPSGCSGGHLSDGTCPADTQGAGQASRYFPLTPSAAAIRPVR